MTSAIKSQDFKEAESSRLTMSTPEESPEGAHNLVRQLPHFTCQPLKSYMTLRIRKTLLQS